MLQQEQIDLINSKTSIIELCVNYAHNFLVLPNVEVRFDDCPSSRFPTMDNAAESFLDRTGIGYIIINGPWFAERIERHQDDVEYFVFHELRHLHQQYQIHLLHKGEEIRESNEIVEEWKNEFDNYIRNEGEESQSENIRQEVEIDATAYGIILETLYQGGKQPILSVPRELVDLADERLQRYIDTLPEFRAYSPVQNRKSHSIDKKRKVGRNDPCPCGSGQKYKRCCGK